jgi:cobalt-zinc-cadmium resistance protein CzcA
MTALMAAIGLLPAAISTGIGSETQKPLAIVVIGGLISSTILTLLVFPLIVELFYKRSHKKKNNQQVSLT